MGLASDLPRFLVRATSCDDPRILSGRSATLLA